MFYRIAKFSIKKVRQIQNLEEANFWDFLWLLMTRNIHPLEYFWTQILNKHFKSKFSRRKLGFLWCELNRTKFTRRCEPCLFRVFFTPRGAVTVFSIFSGLKNIFQEKNPTTFFKLVWSISGRNMQSFDFSIMCHFFMISLGLSRHSLLSVLLKCSRWMLANRIQQLSFYICLLRK